MSDQQYPPPNAIFLPLLPGNDHPPPFYSTVPARAVTIPGTTPQDFQLSTFPILVQYKEHLFPLIISLGEHFGTLADDMKRYFNFPEAPKLKVAWDRTFGGQVEVEVTPANITAALRLAKERASRECRLLVSGGGV